MKIIFPKDSFKKEVDSFFIDEFDAARKVGLDVGFAVTDRIKDTPMMCGLYLPKYDSPTPSIYRGWIISNTGQYYYGFYHSLLSVNNIDLINYPIQYQNAQLLPNSYPHFSEYMVPTLFLNHVTKKSLRLIGKQFKTDVLFVKDYVKSELNLSKIYLEDLDGAIEVVQMLQKERGDMFEGGFAFRPFVELSSNEYRLWVYKGKILNESWETLPKDFDSKMIAKIKSFVSQSNFFTIDIGRYKQNGKPVIIETGDAQVSGLKGLNPEIFYQTLKNI